MAKIWEKSIKKKKVILKYPDMKYGDNKSFYDTLYQSHGCRTFDKLIHIYEDSSTQGIWTLVLMYAFAAVMPFERIDSSIDSFADVVYLAFFILSTTAIIVMTALMIYEVTTYLVGLPKVLKNQSNLTEELHAEWDRELLAMKLTGKSIIVVTLVDKSIIKKWGIRLYKLTVSDGDQTFDLLASNDFNQLRRSKKGEKFQIECNNHWVSHIARIRS